jgi:nucleoid DNA-binding protein
MPTTTKPTTFTKKDLVDLVCRQTGQKPADVKYTLEAVLHVISDLIAKGHRIELRNFGVFEVRYSREKIAQNPRTLEPVTVEARWTVKFKPGGAMRKGLKVTNGAGSDGSGAEPDGPFESGSAVPAPVGGPGSNRPRNNTPRKNGSVSNGHYIEAKPARRGGRG